MNIENEHSCWGAVDAQPNEWVEWPFPRKPSVQSIFQINVLLLSGYAVVLANAIFYWIRS